MKKNSSQDKSQQSKTIMQQINKFSTNPMNDKIAE